MLLWETLPKEFHSNLELVKCAIKPKCAHFIVVVIFRVYWKKISFGNLSKTFISPLVSKLGCGCHLTFFLLQFSSWYVCIKPRNYKRGLLWLRKRAIIQETSHKVCIKDGKGPLFIPSIFPGWCTACHGTLLLYSRFAFFFIPRSFPPVSQLLL